MLIWIEQARSFECNFYLQYKYSSLFLCEPFHKWHFAVISLTVWANNKKKRYYQICLAFGEMVPVRESGCGTVDKIATSDKGAMVLIRVP